MQIQKHKKSRKRFIVITLLVIILVIGLCFSLFIYPYYKTKSNETYNPSHESDEAQAKNLHENPDTKQHTPNTDTPAEPPSTTGTSKQQVQVTASENITNGILFIRGGINYPMNEGNCYALLSNPIGQVIRKETSLLQNPSSTDCKTISIPISELSPGQWSIILHYTSKNYEGSSDAITISL